MSAPSTVDHPAVAGDDEPPLVQLYRAELADLRKAGARAYAATADAAEQIRAWR